MGKVCDPSVCKCDPIKCRNTKENALLEAANQANVGLWVTRDQQRIYIDTDNNEYTGSAAMRRYKSDKKGKPSAPKKRRKRKGGRRRRSR